MGARRKDYERIAPEKSYLHVDDFESPQQLASYLHLLDSEPDRYNRYFNWNGTGEFIDTKFFCRLCAMLHDDGAPVKHYADFNSWWHGPGTCNEGEVPWPRSPDDDGKVPWSTDNDGAASAPWPPSTKGDGAASTPRPLSADDYGAAFVDIEKPQNSFEWSE